MLIDERIEELTEKGAKQLLRRVIEHVAGRMVCSTCAMQIVCGNGATEDDCMRQVLVMLAVPTAKDAADESGDEAEAEAEDAGEEAEAEDAEESPEEPNVIFYDPVKMKIVE